MNNIHTKERGASMVEYALLIVLIALISLPAVGMVGDRTEKTMTTVAEALEQTDGGPVSGAPG
ncbi:MAG: Flp family type IVb pilin, partial [Acidimicrobiales bacterium]|nr:Flp family type IVb pilin [Acidimicrobiales bacterium]